MWTKERTNKQRLIYPTKKGCWCGYFPDCVSEESEFSFFYRALESFLRYSQKKVRCLKAQTRRDKIFIACKLLYCTFDSRWYAVNEVIKMFLKIVSDLITERRWRIYDVVINKIFRSEQIFDGQVFFFSKDLYFILIKINM